MKNQKGAIGLLILVGLLILMGATGGIYYLSKSSPSSPLISQNQPLVTKNNESSVSTTKSSMETLTSTSCHLSVQYPDSWKGEVKDGSGGCAFKIEHPNIKEYYFMMNNVLNTSWDDITAKNPGAKQITIAGVEGITTTPIDDPNLTSVGIYFHKDSTVFNIVYFVKPNDEETKKIYSEIVASIQFTEGANTSLKGFSNGVQTAVDKANRQVVTTDLQNLQQALNSYKKQKGSYPPTLQTLKQSGFIPQLPTNPYTNSGYDYQTNGTTYTLSGKLDDGSEVKVSD